MSTSVENAPLLELIAELRWRPIGLPHDVEPATRPAIIPAQVKGLDEFFMRFGREVHEAGYSKGERLAPEQVPMLAHQPIYRFNSRSEGGTKSLYQVGPGLFSANAVPPYESWSSFGPLVQSGVKALLKSRDVAERDAQFLGATLRYLDAFGPLLTEGRDSATFVREVLGIQIALPSALTQHLQPGAAWKPFLQFHIPVRSNVLLAVAIGDGRANDTPALLMETAVSFAFPIAPEADAVMAAFNEAHELIASSFKKLMAPIAHLMPEKKKA
ncbi:TIGR04255 family protein [Variovorax sp. 2RAF20]